MQKYNLILSIVQSQAIQTLAKRNVLAVTVLSISVKYTSACTYQRGCLILKLKAVTY
jgi:hypothetical protein